MHPESRGADLVERPAFPAHDQLSVLHYENAREEQSREQVHPGSCLPVGRVNHESVKHEHRAQDEEAARALISEDQLDLHHHEPSRDAERIEGPAFIAREQQLFLFHSRLDIAVFIEEKPGCEIYDNKQCERYQ